MTIISRPGVLRAAIYARVSTFDQVPENQLVEIRRYIAARGWTEEEYVDRGISGAKDRRPSLDRLLVDARRRRVDVVVVWRLDRLGRNLRHLITLLEELQALGINPRHENATNVGRPLKIVDGGQVVQEVFG